MTKKFEIIQLSPNDWEKYREIRLEALKNEPLSFLSSFEEEKDKPEQKWRDRLTEPSQILFAKDQDKIVGMVGIYRETNPRLVHLVTIWGLYVNKNYRGQSLGKRLLAEIVAAGKKLPGVEKIKITVNPEKTVPYQLYKSLGFREVGRAEKEVKIGNQYFDEVLFEMLL